MAGMLVAASLIAGFATGGTVTLWANGKLIGGGEMPYAVPIGFSTCAGTGIGWGNGLVVDLAYEDKAPYPFTGTVKKVVSGLSLPPTKTSKPCTNTRRYTG